MEKSPKRGPRARVGWWKGPRDRDRHICREGRSVLWPCELGNCLGKCSQLGGQVLWACEGHNSPLPGLTAGDAGCPEVPTSAAAGQLALYLVPVS